MPLLTPEGMAKELKELVDVLQDTEVKNQISRLVKWKLALARDMAGEEDVDVGVVSRSIDEAVVLTMRWW